MRTSLSFMFQEVQSENCKHLSLQMLTKSKERFDKIQKEAPCDVQHNLIQVTKFQAGQNCKVSCLLSPSYQQYYANCSTTMLRELYGTFDAKWHICDLWSSHHLWIVKGPWMTFPEKMLQISWELLKLLHHSFCKHLMDFPSLSYPAFNSHWQYSRLTYLASVTHKGCHAVVMDRHGYLASGHLMQTSDGHPQEQTSTNLWYLQSERFARTAPMHQLQACSSPNKWLASIPVRYKLAYYHVSP